MEQTFDYINSATSFADGQNFESEQQVREYFTVKNYQSMFNSFCPYWQWQFDEWAEKVITNKWHCNF